MNTELDRDNIRRISRAETKKCMQCGKCSGSCPAYGEMDYHPHQFVAMVENGDIEVLLSSKAIWNCLSCFACVERCPRGVSPANVIEAVRLQVLRSQGGNHVKVDDIPAMVTDDLPQQALVSLLRKYSK